MKKLLLVVDYQYDFAAEHGRLTAGEPALQIEAYIASKIRAFESAGDAVFYTLDAHEQADWQGGHPEGSVFEPHCIKGTPGYELYGDVAALASPAQKIDKRAYCPDIENSPLRGALGCVEAVEIVGLVTDICVFQTAIGVYTYCVNNRLPVAIAVDTKGCASFAPERAEWALDYLKDVLGIQIL